MTGKLLTAEELEVLRERYSAPIWDKVGLDHRPLLAHVDALQAQLREARTSQMLLSRIAWSVRTQLCVQQSAAGHILAWQQARGIVSRRGLLAQAERLARALDTIADYGCDGWGDETSCSCHPCRAEDALSGIDTPSQLATLRDENERLREVLEAIRTDARHALANLGPHTGMHAPYHGMLAATVRTPSGARDARELIRMVNVALSEGSAR